MSQELTSEEIQAGTKDAPLVPATLAEKWNEVQAAKLAHHEAKEHAANRKKAWESKQEEFDKLMASIIEECPLFEGKTPAKPGTSDPGDDDDSWRSELLSSIFSGFGVIINKMREAGLQNLGQLSDFLAQNHAIQDIEGIGAVKAEMVEQALEAFWKKWQARKPTPTTPEPDGNKPKQESIA